MRCGPFVGSGGTGGAAAVGKIRRATCVTSRKLSSIPIRRKTLDRIDAGPAGTHPDAPAHAAAS
ncbi:hypothetical protein TPA0908_29910 [Micromonospora sp. AKA38]|nr:hypothetical protein TPA0908_29910 [Micromonospora sp. AKA38]